MACTVAVSARVGLTLAMMVWADPGWAWTLSPKDQVKSTIGRIVELLRDSGLQGDRKGRERSRQVRQAMESRFDFAEMAKRSLGTHWRRYPTRQREFIPVFSDFMQDVYLGLMGSYKDGKFSFIDERIDATFAEVGTRVLLPNGDGASIHYRLHQVDDQWKAYDVLIEHVSLVNNYRSQLSRILSRTSFDELLRKLAERRPQKDLLRAQRLHTGLPYVLFSLGLSDRRVR